MTSETSSEDLPGTPDVSVSEEVDLIERDTVMYRDHDGPLSFTVTPELPDQQGIYLMTVIIQWTLLITQ